jgi:hypothetical protein
VQFMLCEEANYERFFGAVRRGAKKLSVNFFDTARHTEHAHRSFRFDSFRPALSPRLVTNGHRLGLFCLWSIYLSGLSAVVVVKDGQAKLSSLPRSNLERAFPGEAPSLFYLPIKLAPQCVPGFVELSTNILRTAAHLFE